MGEKRPTLDYARRRERPGIRPIDILIMLGVLLAGMLIAPFVLARIFP